MDKLKLHTPDITAENIAKLAELFPNCVTESLSKDGTLKQSVDFDQLRQELSNTVVEGPQERYQLNWPGKREALLTANAPISKTLRPCREESVDFDTTKNLYIEGDNLDALKLLQETYLNKVKMIYIDPPYNTGNDFIYEDDFKMESKSYLLKSDQLDEEGDRLVTNSESNGRFHSDWLTMMYSRLRLSRNLLADDGVIFISIDENEVVNMKKICDEIFGEDNFIENFIWKKSYGGGPKERYAVTQHEYILLYTKVISNLDNFSLRYDPAKITRYYKHKDQHHELRGPYRLKPLEATKSMDSRPNLVYGIPAPDGHEIQPKRQWLWSKARVIKALENGELEFIGSGEKQTVNYKQYLKDENGIERGEKPFSIIDGIYTQKGTDDIRKIFDDKVLIQFPKPVDLISKLVEIGCGNKRDSIVLDFFSGSATSAHAVMALNADDGGERRHIMVQLPETCGAKSEAFKAGYATIAEIGRERIRRSGKKIKAENINKPSVQSLDIGFRVFKIDSSNMKDIYYAPDEVSQDDLFSQASNIREDRTPEDLLFQVLLDWGVDLALPISQETIAGKTVFFVDTDALAACFDTGIDEFFIKELAERKPLRAVFRDSGFANDSVKINAEQIFKHSAPNTDIKVI